MPGTVQKRWDLLHRCRVVLLTIAFAFLIVGVVSNLEIFALSPNESCRGKHSGRTTPCECLCLASGPFTQLAIQKFVLFLQSAYWILKAPNPFFEPNNLSIFGRVTLVGVS